MACLLPFWALVVAFVESDYHIVLVIGMLAALEFPDIFASVVCNQLGVGLVFHNFVVGL